jgi:hypothetical protein
MLHCLAAGVGVLVAGPLVGVGVWVNQPHKDLQLQGFRLEVGAGVWVNQPHKGLTASRVSPKLQSQQQVLKTPIFLYLVYVYSNAKGINA